jgi:Arc/MetJ-type ribon-helix-helix transcriptional regulator
MVSRWAADGRRYHARMADAEKITINMNVVDLGKVDLLVEEGFYANRTDFIRTAIRNLLARHDDEVRNTVGRRHLIIGVLHYGREELEEYQAAGQRLSIAVAGLLTLGQDVTPELAREVIKSIKIVGAFRASDAVKSALADRTR